MTVRCAVYTRKSSEEGLEQSFNSLDAQREACEAYVRSQQHEGWICLPHKYDDGGFSGGNMGRPALQKLLDDVSAGKVDTIVVYKIDRLTRSLFDFAKIVEQLDKKGVSFVSVTQQFNTTTSMGRLTLNVLLSFAQFEREVTGERIRDKIAASKRKGMWMGGNVPLGYDLQDRKLVPNEKDAALVKQICEAYLEQGCVSKLQEYLEQKGIRSKVRTSRSGKVMGGTAFSRGALYLMLQNRVYLGEIRHKDLSHPGQHAAIISKKLWEQVQLQLKTNLQAERTRPRATESSMLLGLLCGGQGNRFTPSHARKNGRKYRYYVCQATKQRIPAGAIEKLVTSVVEELLRSPRRLFDLLQDKGGASQEALQRINESALLSCPSPAQFLRTVVISDGEIQIALSVKSIVERVGLDHDTDETHMIAVPACFKRCGGESRLVLPPDQMAGTQRERRPLVQAVARAHDWVQKIVSGECDNARALAKATGFDERYISRFMPLAFLAPDLTEAILDGEQNSELTLHAYVADLPIGWQEQRTLFGGTTALGPVHS